MKHKTLHHLVDYYQSLCQRGIIKTDSSQLAILNQLQIVSDDLHKEHRARKKMSSFLRRPQLVKGVYLWGSVGIGKTFIIDSFFSQIHFPQKMRMHFHAFMQYVHQQLKMNQGKKDPLFFVAKQVAKHYLLLCLDEFMVTDITDAMILRQLISALFKYGVCIVTTSNTMPDNLYLGGLQRSLFLPAIESLKKHLLIMHVESTKDYRIQKGLPDFTNTIKMTNLAEQEIELRERFNTLSTSPGVPHTQLFLSERRVMVRYLSENIVWFDFEKICSPPRNQEDYLALSAKFNYIFISNVPKILSWEHNKISLFIKLIDVIYDHNIQLFYSSSFTPQEIYPEGIFSGQYQRTCSRLLEILAKQNIY